MKILFESIVKNFFQQILIGHRHTQTYTNLVIDTNAINQPPTLVTTTVIFKKTQLLIADKFVYNPAALSIRKYTF